MPLVVNLLSASLPRCPSRITLLTLLDAILTRTVTHLTVGGAPALSLGGPRRAATAPRGQAAAKASGAADAPRGQVIAKARSWLYRAEEASGAADALRGQAIAKARSRLYRAEEASGAPDAPRGQAIAKARSRLYRAEEMSGRQTC